MAAELLVIGFEGTHRATEVLNRLEELSASWAIDLKDAVAVYRAHDGRLHVDQSVQATPREGAAWSAVIGGLLGVLVFGPLTAGATVPTSIAAITAGAGMFGVTAAAFGADDARRWKETTGISDDFVKSVGGMVQPGQSAVFVLARATDPAKVEEQFRGYGGKILRTTLPKDAAAKFQELMNPLATTAR